MLNSVILIGRLVDTPTLRNYDNDYMVTTITLAVSRPFKNMEGEVDTDFIRISVWDIVAKNTCDFCRKGDLIAVRGRLQSKYSEVTFEKDKEVYKKKISTMEVIGERIIFLMTSGSKPKELIDDEIIDV